MTKKGKCSIIMCAYDVEVLLQRWITSTVLDNIQRYTNRDEYELILVDNSYKWPLDENIHYFEIDNHIKLEDDIGFSNSMNLGAKESDPECEYIAFMHNDVFVWEGWLPKLIECLDKYGVDAVVPNQGCMRREDVLTSYKKEIQLDNDAGLMLMTKKTFKKSGGWPKQFKAVFMEAAYRIKLAKKGLKLAPVRGEVLITHSGKTTCWLGDDRFFENRTIEGKILARMEAKQHVKYKGVKDEN